MARAEPPRCQNPLARRGVPVRRPLGWIFRLLAAAGSLTLVLVIASVLLLRSQWLREQMRLRLIAEIERVTGGKVLMKSFDFDPRRLRASVEEFTLRGKEAENEPPLAWVGKIEVGFKIRSLLRRQADLESLIVHQPRIRIVSYPDGTTNIPGPRIPRADKRTVFEHFVRLSARRFQLSGGWFAYDHRRIPLDLRADDLHIDFHWEPAGSRYRGTVSAAPFLLNWPPIEPLRWRTEVRLTMDAGGLSLEHVRLSQGGAQIVAHGFLSGYRAPKIDVRLDGRFSLADYAPKLRLPISPEGVARLRGDFHYDDGRYAWTGRLDAAGLAVRRPQWSVEDVSLTAEVQLNPERILLRELQATALDGSFAGSAEVTGWRRFGVRGVLHNFSLDQIRQLENTVRPVAWSALVSGPVAVSGSIAQDVPDLALDADLRFVPQEGNIPLEGLLKFSYRRADGLWNFDASYLKTPRTRVDFSGRLDDQVRFRMDSSDLNDLLPAAAFAGFSMPLSLPVQLDGGTAHIAGSIRAPLSGPRIQAEFALTRAVVEKQPIDRASGTIQVDETRLLARQIRVSKDGAEIKGELEAGLSHWRLRPNSALEARVAIAGLSVQEQLARFFQPADVSGLLSGTARIGGSVGEPSVSATLTLQNAVMGSEPFSAIRTEILARPGRIEFHSGRAAHESGQISFHGSYAFDLSAWQTGVLDLTMVAGRSRLGRFHGLRRRVPDLDGLLDVDLGLQLGFSAGRPAIRKMQGKLTLAQVVYRREPLGSLSLNAEAANGRLEVAAAGSLLGAPVRGKASWAVDAQAAGVASLETERIPLAAVRRLLSALDKSAEFPFDGSLRAQADLEGSLRDLRSFRARLRLAELELLPLATNPRISAAMRQELRLTNRGPILAEIVSGGLTLRQAALSGKDTSVEVSGAVSTGASGAWNLAIRGSVNLAILSNFVADLQASGTAVMNATVRGALNKPQLGGRMEIRNASFYYNGLPNGIDQAAGAVAFDRNRALLQDFTGQTGGGGLKLNGFLAFGEGDRPFAFRLNGQMERVRIRYPQGASTTLNANLALTGTLEQSLLTGALTILRSGFTPRTDLGKALLEPSRPVTAPADNEFLRGLQFDVRIQSAPNLQLETSLTQGVQADVDLRLRGSPAKPVVLGTVAVTQGEFNFFGTTYSLTRGTISFFNAARIEPVVDFDLETVVRAVTVNMKISGPIDRPNITYRSDPPLQSQEIVALLAVGRTPTGSTIATQTNIGGGGNLYNTETLLGQALSAGISSPLRRFFGVSRVKIDPQNVGLETTPQARLTIEQQISRDITLTYVTNLTGALQQIVRLQWDLSRQWSVSGVRDENGVLGADLLFRKRFK